MGAENVTGPGGVPPVQGSKYTVECIYYMLPTCRDPPCNYQNYQDSESRGKKNEGWKSDREGQAQ